MRAAYTINAPPRDPGPRLLVELGPIPIVRVLIADYHQLARLEVVRRVLEAALRELVAEAAP